jgi:DNA-binding GntR family transcriptional regulator
LDWVEHLEQPQTLTEAVTSLIRNALRSGSLKPGDPINEAELARQLGISRAPVREATRILEQQGLLEIVPRKGVCVTDLSAEDLKEVCTLRAALEGLALRLAVEKGAYDHSTISELQSLVDQMRSGSDPLERLDTDEKFHELLCAKSNHKLLLGVLSNLRLKIRQAHISARFVDENFRNLADRHQAVVDAIARGDAEAAEQTIKEHVIQAAELRLQSLDQKG